MSGFSGNGHGWTGYPPGSGQLAPGQNPSNYGGGYPNQQSLPPGYQAQGIPNIHMGMNNVPLNQGGVYHQPYPPPPFPPSSQQPLQSQGAQQSVQQSYVGSRGAPQSATRDASAPTARGLEQQQQTSPQQQPGRQHAPYFNSRGGASPASVDTYHPHPTNVQQFRGTMDIQPNVNISAPFPSQPPAPLAQQSDSFSHRYNPLPQQPAQPQMYPQPPAGAAYYSESSRVSRTGYPQNAQVPPPFQSPPMVAARGNQWAPPKPHGQHLPLAAPHSDVYEQQRRANYARNAFRTADRDNSGYLDFKEFLDTLRSLNLSISYHQALDRFAKMDQDKDGRIGLNEFVKEYFELLHALKRDM